MGTISQHRFLTTALALVVLGACYFTAPARAHGNSSISEREYEVKAALVYNFARFTQWPDTAFAADQKTLSVVVFGDNNSAWDFHKIAGKNVGGRVISIKVTRDPQEVAGCQILFLMKQEREQWPQVLSALGSSPTLIIGEMNGFLGSGGVINLALHDGKISFLVNLDNAKSRQISISSRILKLASEVVGTKRENP